MAQPDDESAPEDIGETPAEPRGPRWRLERTVALIGLMGAGKSAIGKRVAAAIGARFRDADAEIVEAAGMTISEIFERYGEPYFRDREQRVIARLLEETPQVLATGGGAYMNAATRAVLKENAFTLWLKADLDTLVMRCSRRSTRPLLQRGDPRQTLLDLMRERYPTYAQADAVVESRDGPHEQTVAAALEQMERAGVLTQIPEEPS